MIKSIYDSLTYYMMLMVVFVLCTIQICLALCVLTWTLPLLILDPVGDYLERLYLNVLNAAEELKGGNGNGG